MRLIVLTALAAALAPCADAPKADLTLKDAGGHKVRLRDLRGKPVVLNFWATWCGPCNSEMPMLVEMEKQYAARGVLFIGASMDDAKTRAKVPAFVAEHEDHLPGMVRRHGRRSRRTQIGRPGSGHCLPRRGRSCRLPHPRAGAPRRGPRAPGLAHRRPVEAGPASSREAFAVMPYRPCAPVCDVIPRPSSIIRN